MAKSQPDESRQPSKPRANPPSEQTSFPSVAVGLVDIHCHLLPGVDDGCRDTAESLTCARRLVEAGITHAICTPHIERDLPHNTAVHIPVAVAALQRKMDEAGIPLVLLPGGETRIGPHSIDAPADDLVLMCGGNSRGGRFFLFDTWENRWPDYLEPALRRLQSLDITPIMAHPERCPFVLADPIDAAERLSDLGVLLQLNSYILLEGPAKKGLHVDSAMRHCAQRLLEFDHYDFLATDAHRPEQMDVRLAGLAVARETLGEEAFRRLTHRNPSQLLPG